MRKFFAWLQKRIKHWIKPAPPGLISELLSDLTRNRTDLIEENALLRQQLIILKRQVKHPRLTDSDRFRLVLLSHFTNQERPHQGLGQHIPDCYDLPRSKPNVESL